MPTLYAGLDVSDLTTAVCIVDSQGSIIFEHIAETSPASIAVALKPYRKSLKGIGLEAGSQSAWLHKGLTSKAFVVHCLDPWRAHRVISTRLNKTDRNDAQGLATLLARGIFPTTHVKSDDARRIRAVLQLRQLLLRKAVDIEHAVRMIRKSFGPPSSASFQPETLTEPLLRNSIELACEASENLREQYESIDRYVKSLAGQHPVCQRLMTVPGIGPITALTFFAAIDDPYRFKCSRDVAPYFGLTPRVYQSGEMRRSGGISHRGDVAVRRALYCAGMVLLDRTRSDCALRQWGLKIAKAKNKRLAYIACARKIAVLLHHLWITDQVFDPTL